MEWREQSAVSCDDAFLEAQRWVEAVTKKTFGSNNFRSALENGVLLCDLINRIKPGVIKRVNRLSTPIAGLDNVNVFLKACGKLGLKEAQLFHPGDLQDLSTRVTVKHQETSRRLKNVLITIYWLGRKAQSDPFYNGPYLNLKAFEGLLGIALSKALEDSFSSPRGSSVRDSGFGDSWYSEREELFPLRRGGHRREDSLDSLDSLGSRPHSISSDTTLKGSSEGCCSDAEAESVFRMAENKDSLHYRRSLVIAPKTTTQFNQFLPTKDKDKAMAYVPAPLRKKRAERHEDNRRSWASPTYTEEDGTFTSETRPSSTSDNNGLVSQSSLPAAHLQWAYEYESGSDSDQERPDPDLVLDDLASRRFHSPSPAPPTNFALPISPLEAGGAVSMGRGGTSPMVTVTANASPRQTVTCLSSSSSSGLLESPQHSSVRVDHHRPQSADSLLREMYDDSEDEEDDVGYADPVQDDLYARKVGLSPQPPANVPYDRFLPKFWTPEEDIHVQKIKLGSQRRPWYKKIQGFSRKKLGSSSDESDCDISPWLSSAPSPSGPSPSHSHAPEVFTHTAHHAGQSSYFQPHAVPQPPKQQPPQLERPPLVFARLDPTAGPRLVKCERRPLLGRQDPLEPPDLYDEFENIVPDLENDDMFTRRTQAFHSNTDLAVMKTRVCMSRTTGSLCFSDPEINIVTQPRRSGSKGKPRLPDIQRDDVLYRKVNPQQAHHQRPLSGAPDRYNPVPIPEPWALPPKLQARLLCTPSPLAQEAEPEGNQDQAEGHHRADDMLLRKFGAGMGSIQGQGPSASQMSPSVPTSCSEEDLQKWKEIREASRLRFKKRMMVERLLQNRDDSDGSKSMSDITGDDAALKQMRYEELQKIREKVKESDDQWQDDLTKWKNRRKSVNSDIVKKKEEREQTEQVTAGGSGRRSRTFKEMQEGREKSSVGSRLSSLSLLDQDVFEDPTPVPAPVPRTRTLPARSYTIDTPYASVDRPTAPSAPLVREEEPPTAARATNRAASPPPTTQGVDREDISAGSDTIPTTRISSRTSIYNPHSTTQAPMERSTSPALEHTSTAKKEETSTTSISTPSSLPKVFEPRRPWAGKPDEEVAPSSGSLYKQPQYNSMEPRPPGVSRVSASLPRSYQRSDSARLTSVVTPRPFGTQSTRIASLPRAYTMDDSHKRVNGGVDNSKKLSVPSRYSQVMNSEDEARSHSSSAHSSNEEDEEEEEEEGKGRGVTPTQKVSPVPPRSEPLTPLPKAVSPVPVSPGPVKDTNQESYSDMRISLNQKPNSSRDFGFHADWDQSRAHITSIQPGSPAEQCQLQVGDEVLAVSGHRVADMSYDEWERSMEESLQQGRLVMDIRRHGRNNWDRDLLSPPYKSHKIINLTSVDHPTVLGSPDPATVNTSLDFTSHKPTDTTVTTKEVAAYPIIDVASNGMNGGFRDDSVTMRTKETMSLKNLKRRSEFFEQGGSESAISDLAVPSITPSSTRWSWDPEEERRRQEKWQREQELLLQEKYKRDQEKLDEEWRKAQREAVTVGSKHQWEEQKTLEVDSRSISPLSPLSQHTSPWEDQEVAQEEERRRREQEEQQRQEEERGKRDEEERELLRLQEERKRREELEEEERKKREEDELKWQRRREEERRRQEATELQRRERERAQEQQQWAGDSHGYARHEISMADRAKSKSTPELDDVEKPEAKGWYSRGGGMAQRFLEEELRRKRDRKEQSLRAASELELERRNILNAMRYRQPERVASSGPSEASSWARKGQGQSQAEQERQQILREMKKKTHLTTDNSWIRQRSTSTTTSKEPETLAGLIRRGESLDNLDVPRSSWRSSWTPGSTSSIPNYSRPHSALSGNTSSYGGGYSGRPGSATLPSSLSMSSLRQGGGNPSSWSQRSPSPSSPSPTLSPGPGPGEDSAPESRPSSQQHSRSVSGKKICTFCDTPLGKGAAMIIESLGLCYHLTCFKCIDCKSDLGGSEAGAEVRIRNRQLYCNSCYMRFKTGQPTSM